MKIAERFAATAKDVWNQPNVTIAFLGDSVTHGCFAGATPHEFYDKDYAYHTNVAAILHHLYPNMPVNIINAGISGGNAPHGYERLERDVLCHKPDLVVVCFGLNDSGGPLDAYTTALDNIFKKLNEEGIEAIFMTPNMVCTEVNPRTPEAVAGVAKSCSINQTTGVMDKFMDAAREVAAKNGVKVCDCYAKWKKLYEAGVNTNELLSNCINHPSREMHWMFAYSLVETMLFE